MSGLIYNDLYAADVSQAASAPLSFSALVWPLTNGADLDGRHSHDCKLVQSFPGIGIQTPGVLVFGGIAKTVWLSHFSIF